jgi:hypothetical protein
MGLSRSIEQDKFRRYFQEKVSPSEDRWDAFQNMLNEHYLQELITKTEILRDEISFALSNIEISDDKPFEFLKRLSAAILSMRNTTLGYDETKQFSGAYSPGGMLYRDTETTISSER